MIIIYGLPPQTYDSGGMQRRIAHIDTVFSDKKRIYCYPAAYAGCDVSFGPCVRDVNDLVSFFPFAFEFSAHRNLFTSLLRQADFLYAHTVHSGQYLFPYYRTGKIITDIHGVAPEEELMLGHPERARFYEVYEKELFHGSYRIVCVTDAMRRHYQEKYHLPAERFILLPIVPDTPCEGNYSGKSSKRIVYAGGLQQWQCVPQMLDAAAKLGDDFEFRFLSNEHEQLKRLAQEKGVASRVDISVCAPQELGQHYAWADYGLVLREPSVVNKVACPTKLMEYAASGAIPIIESEEIGDFFDLGGKGVLLSDMLAGKLPDAEERTAILQANINVIDIINKRALAGERELREIFSPTSAITDDEWEYLFLDDESRCCLFPACGAWLQDMKVTYERDICSLSHKVSYRLREEGSISYQVQPVPAFITQLPKVVLVFENGTRKKPAKHTHNFKKITGGWVLINRRNILSIPSEALRGAASIEISIDIVAAGGQVYRLGMFQEHCFDRIKRRLKKMLPENTIIGEVVRKFYRRFIKYR